MPRGFVATPLFRRRLEDYLDEYAAKGATRFVERLRVGYGRMIADITSHEQIGIAKRLSIKGQTIAVRQDIIDAGARNFVVLYWIPPQEDQPIVFLNIRISRQNRFRWG